MVMNQNYREEHDSVGSFSVPAASYYGIHTLRAVENFPILGQPMDFLFVRQIALIKKAAALVNGEAGFLTPEQTEAIVWACDEILAGKHADAFPVDALQGGAGTSANMNVNEVLANLAIEHMGGKPGDYAIVHPNDHVNMAQSTNDVIPTAGKLTVLRLSEGLLTALKELEAVLLEKSEEFDDILKPGRTQLQDAVPMRLGQTFHAWATAINRDIRRILHALDAMRTVNLGATAIGTGINTSAHYFHHVCPKLSELFGEPISQAEDLFDCTQNVDCFAQVSGALKTCAIDISKMCRDLRLLSSGPQCGIGELNLPPRQNGSSIMPGKINPVIPESVNQVCYLVFGHDVTINFAAEAGQLELNAFEPVIFHQLFESFRALTGAARVLNIHCIRGITANRERCRDLSDRCVGVITALAPHIGYKTASGIAGESLRTHTPVRELVLAKGLLSEEELDRLLDIRRLTEPGQDNG